MKHQNQRQTWLASLHIARLKHLILAQCSEASYTLGITYQGNTNNQGCIVHTN
jgi:hypothetical protein